MKMKIDHHFSIVLIEDFKIISSQDALDLLVNVRFNNSYSKIILNESQITDDFFDLSSGMANDILEKYSNYDVKLAIILDPTKRKSEEFNEFMISCNQGSCFLFCLNLDNAISMLNKI